MSAHIHDELPGVLTGEADRATLDAFAEHMSAGCASCCQDLASVVQAYAAIESAKRYAPQLFRAELNGTATDDTVGEDEQLPDLSNVFAQIEARPDKVARAGAHAKAKQQRRRPVGRGWIAAAAVVVGVAAGVGGEYLVNHHSTSSSVAVHVVHLAPFDIGTTPGTAKIIGDSRITIGATSLPSVGTTKFYQAWLTNAARTELLSLGPLGPDGAGSYRLPAHLINTYSAIEVSVQQVNGNPAFSGVSVLRGSYR
jgi:Anti-sigma-K factor rskA